MTIYLEGGGDSEAQKSACQRAFAKFFEAAGLKGRMPRLVACGGRGQAYAKFKVAISAGNNALLLVDSEVAVEKDPDTGKPVESPWIHLKKRDNWERPSGATDNHVHFMVECMESWFIADKDQFILYYSKDNRRCNPNVIPDVADVESISKAQVYGYLERASLPSGDKVKYSKGSRSFEILATTRPEAVARASWHTRRLFCRLGITADWLNCAAFKEEQV